MAETETIVKVQAQSGALSVVRRLNKGTWSFEAPPAEPGTPAASQPNLAAALADFDRLHWAELPPVIVHPSFVKVVVDAALKRLEAGGKTDAKALWQTVLTDGGKPKPGALAPAAAGQTLVLKNEAQPAWGAGVVTEDTREKWVIYFEDGKSRTFAKSHAKTLVPGSLSPERIATLQAKASGRRAAASAASSRSARAKAFSRPAFSSFQDQLSLFTKTFEGGFGGAKWIEEERGKDGATGKAGKIESSLVLFKAELTKDVFGKGPDAVFDAVKKVLQSTSLVFPIEGAVPWGTLAQEKRAGAVKALEDVLFGSGSYPERLERFAQAVELKDKNGTVRHASWPLATVFGALADPSANALVKPKPFASQGAMIGVTAEATLPVTQDKYGKFLQVLTKTKELLVAAGQQPRDLIDVQAFIVRTQAEKPE